MKKAERIEKNIRANKDLYKAINRMDYFDISDFIQQGERYTKACKENRIICNIESVSSSGMSRTIKFASLEKSTYHKKPYYNLCNFYTLFKILGYSEVKDTGYFRIHGCGMDMIFNTNYNNIHDLHRLGFINKKQCDNLCQNTPPII